MDVKGVVVQLRNTRRNSLGRRLVAIAGLAALACGIASALPQLARADATHTFSGVVRDRDGSPLAGQTVTLFGGPFPASAQTASDGSFSVQAAPGSYTLQLSGGAFAAPPLFGPPPPPTTTLPGSYFLSGPTIDLSNGDRRQDLSLPVIYLDVSALTPDGGPLADANVDLRQTFPFMPGFFAPSVSTSQIELYPGGSASGAFNSNKTTDQNGHARLVLFPADNLSLAVTPPPGSGVPFLTDIGSVIRDTSITVPRRATPRDTSPPAITPNVSGTLGNEGWYTSDVAVSWDVADAESGVATRTGCDATTVASDTVGTTFTCSAANGAGLSASRSVTVKRDATPPAVTRSLVPAEPDGRNGWYRSNVTIAWTVSDDGSGIASSSGCAAAAVALDTAGTLFRCTVTDRAGLSRDASVTIRRDTRAPSIQHTVTPAAPDGASGWYVTAPTVTFACTDDTSGVASCAADGQSGASRTLGEASGDQLVAGTAADQAGNESHDGAGPFRVDLSNPIITCGGAPTFLLNQAGAGVSAAVADAVSGPAVASLTNVVSTAAVGAFTTSFTGRDVAGRQATATCAYNVVYDWAGFLAPVANTGFNARQAGSAVPLKFSLHGNQGLAVIAADFPRSQQVTCDTGAPVAGSAAASTPGAAALEYDALTDTYTWVWKTDVAWVGTCRQLSLKLNDGTVHTALFRFG